MKIFKKIIIYFSAIILVASFFIVAILWKSGKDSQTRDVLFGYARKMKIFVYYQATIHNPKGDVFPDQVDDAIFSEIRRVSN